MLHTIKPVLNQALAATAVAFLLSIPVSFNHAAEPAPAPEEAVQVDPQTTELHALTPLTTLIASGESATAGDYNAANNGYPMDLGKHGLRSYFGRDASQITIGEIMHAQANYNLHAVGRYQIIGVTMRSAVEWADLSPSDHFTPENQDRLFLALIKHKRPQIWAYLSGSSSSINGAINALAREWSSMPTIWGYSYYGGYDRSHATTTQVATALRDARSAVLAL